MQCSGRPEKDVGIPRTGISDNYEPPHGCWEPESTVKAASAPSHSPSFYSKILIHQKDSGLHLFCHLLAMTTSSFGAPVLFYVNRLLRLSRGSGMGMSAKAQIVGCFWKMRRVLSVAFYVLSRG